MQRIFITGGTGAVGRYVIDELLTRTDADLVVLVRAHSPIPPVLRNHPRLTTVVGDIAAGAELATRLPPVDRAVLLATSWGPMADAVNLDGTAALVDGLRERGVQHVVWFGTASIIAYGGESLPDAVAHGTPYIRTKALVRERLLRLHTEALTIVHPTLVAAGGNGLPESHLTRLLHEIEQRGWLARWISGEGSFHLVHAADLARMVRQIVVRQPSDVPREIVAGAPAVTIDEMLALLLERAGRRRGAAVQLTPRRIEWLIRLFRLRLSEWDRRCLAARHFTYRDATLTLDPSDEPRYATARAVMAAIPRRHA